VDLETGEWREYKANDYITNRAAVAYTRGAVNRRWEEFVARVMPDTGVREFVQTAVGYSLTGLTNEDKLFILHGNGCNGKSTFTSAILNMLGTYGAQASSELLLRKRASGPSNDMFVLLGKRFVSATETGETCQLDENLVKQMTGGERVSVNPKYKSQIEFTPSWKTWLSTNHEPVIRGTDEAIWRRLVLVPFNVTIGKSHRDPKLRTHLANNYEGRAGILNWALEGVIKWVRNGLIIPTQISDATAHYRQSQDPIGQFMQEMCHISQNVMVRKGVLYDAYCQFCLKNHDQPRTKNAFSRYMHFRGIGESRDMDARFWVGIELDNSVSILPGDAE
jgi:putative DNA primase/helicase